jgi:very-short-patch-repair endonuclease
VLWAGPDARISHAAAAVLWDLDGVTTRRLELTVANDRRPRSPMVTVHRSRTLADGDDVLRHGIPVTSIERTLIDVAGSLPTRSLELAVEDALRRRLTNPTRLQRRLEPLEWRGRSGPGRLHALLEARDGQAVTGSAAEVRLAQLLVNGGLPAPVRQHAVTHAGHTIRVDLAYPDRRLAIEFDSLRWHTGRAKLDNDAERRNLLRAAGWEQVTITFTMLNDRPERAFRVVAAAYEDRAGICWTNADKGWPEMSNKPGEGREAQPAEKVASRPTPAASITKIGSTTPNVTHSTPRRNRS